MKGVMLIGMLVVALVAFAAASDQHRMVNCPLNVEGANVAIADTGTGVEITFTTNSGEPAVTELQRRVERLAKMHRPLLNGIDMTRLMPGDVEYEPVSEGARLILTPKDPNRLDAFRAQVREHVEHMKNGRFPMMENMMKMMDERLKGDPSNPRTGDRLCLKR
jgi:hypothetical protein